MSYLADRPGELITQGELLDNLWADAHVQPEVMKSQVKGLRTLLGDDARNPRYIETQHRRGYRFIAPVLDVTQDASTFSPDQQPLPVGLQAPVSLLMDIFAKALSADSQIVFVTGEVGIGKTTLVNFFENELQKSGTNARVLRGQCVEGYGGREPYFPILEALSGLLRSALGEEIVDLLERFAPTVLVQFPSLVKASKERLLIHQLAGATKERMLRELSDLLGALTVQLPMVMILEDVHWADPSTVDWFGALARARKLARLLVIATCRNVDLALTKHPLLMLKKRLLAHQLCREISLGPLSCEETHSLLASKVPAGRAPSELSNLLYRQSEGNPLFIVAALEHLLSDGALTLGGEGWEIRRSLSELAPIVPETLRSLLETHIEAHLSETERRALEVASVCGVLFSPVIVGKVLECRPEQVEEICNRLARQGHFIRQHASLEVSGSNTLPQYEFVHSLYREILYRMISTGRRQQLHRLVGRSLEEIFRVRSDEVAAQLAHHFAECSEWKLAALYLYELSKIESQRFAYADAAKILERALKLLEKVPRRDAEGLVLNIHMQLASVYALNDMYKHSTRALTKAVESALLQTDHRLKCRLLIRLAGPLARLDSERCLHAADEALLLSRQDPDPLFRAEIQVCAASFHLMCSAWSSENANAAHSAFEQVRGTSDSVDMARCRALHAVVLYFCSRYRESFQALDEAGTVLRNARDPMYREVERIKCNSFTLAGELGRAVTVIERSIRSSKEDGNSLRETIWMVNLAAVHLVALDYATAYELCKQSLEVLRSSEGPSILLRCLILLGHAEAMIGKLSQAREHLNQVEDLMQSGRVLFRWRWSLNLRDAELSWALATGRMKEARRLATAFLEESLHTEEHTAQALAWNGVSEVSLRESNRDMAREAILHGVALVNEWDLPLAAWRVHLTAYRTGLDDGCDHRLMAMTSVRRLAESLSGHPNLRTTLLRSKEIASIMDS